MKRSSNFRYNTSWIDLRDDGRFPKERIKGKTKRWLGKWSRKRLREMMEKE